jgi:hypothetical protein
MGQLTPDRRHAHSDSDPDSPQVVVVEVTVQSNGEAPRRSVGVRGGGARRWRVVLAIGVLAALLVVGAAALVVDGNAGSRHSAIAAAREHGPAGVAAAYGWPLGCLSVTILAADRAYARADLSHTAGCGRTTGYAPAVFHYVGGRWQLVPDAIGYMCFAGAVPAVVEQGLDLCVGTIGRGCAPIATPGQGRPAAPLGWPCAKLPEIAGVV